MPRVAVVTLVRNEEDWVEGFLDHHRVLGVEHAFVYLDRCTDATAERAGAFPWVTTIEWDRPAEHRWLSDFQVEVVADALDRSRRAGFDWLVFIDVDEYAWGGPVGSVDVEEGRLDGMLHAVDDDIDVVRLPTVEVVPESAGSVAARPGRARLRPWAYVHVQPDGRFTRTITDPTTGESRNLPGWIGHPRGKTAVRVDADLRLVDAHTWIRPDGSTPPEVVRGAHLHLVVADGSHWRSKYRKLAGPDHWPGGEPVPFPKDVFNRAAPTMSEEAAAAYFDESLAVRREDLIRGLIETTVRRWPLLRATLDAAGHRPLRAEQATRVGGLDHGGAAGEVLPSPVPPASGGSAPDTPASGAPVSGSSGLDRRVAFIGLDAFDIDVARPWAASGELPVLASLLARGRCTPTEAPPGLFTGAVWPSIWTGVDPGHHGYHCWKQIRPGTYDFELHQVSEHGLAAEPFWADLRRQGRTAVIIDPPHTAATDGLAGAQVLEWGGHDAVVPPSSIPADLIEDVLDRYGEHPSWGNCNQHGRGAAEHGEFRDRMVQGACARADLTVELYRGHRPDLLVSVFGEGHCIGHQAWHLHDPEAPDHDPDLIAEVGDPVLAVYRAVDAGLGRILDALDPGTETFVLCSHGMGTHTDPTFLLDDVLLRLEAGRRFDRPRRWLRAADRIVARARGVVDRRSSGPVRVVVARTVALLVAPLVALLGRRVHERTFRWIAGAELADRRWFQQPNNEPEGAIRLNRVGREPNGIIGDDEVDAEIDWLTEALHELRDADGAPIVRDVLLSRDLYDGPCLDVLPDLLVRWHRRSRMADRVSSPRIGEIHRPYQGVRTGDHHPRGLLIRLGSDIEPGEATGTVRVERIAAEVTEALGC